MKVFRILIIGLIPAIILIVLCMQLSVTENTKTIRNVYASKGIYKSSDNLQIDSLIFYKMNWKNHYDQCKKDSCFSNLEIKHPIAFHFFFLGKIYYTYRLMVFDKNGKPVYACGYVPAWITISKIKWKWRIVDFHEEM